MLFRSLPEEVTAYGVSEGLPVPVESGRIEVPAVSGDGLYMSGVFIDWNHHVNNIQLLRMALTYLPKGYVPRVVRVVYHRPIRFGETIYPAFAQDGNEIAGGFVNAEGEAYCYFSFRDVMTKEEAAVRRL